MTTFMLEEIDWSTREIKVDFMRIWDVALYWPLAEVGVRVPRHDLPPHQAHRQGDGLRDGGFQVLRVRPEGGRNQGGGGQYWVLCRLYSLLRRVFRRRCWWWGWTPRTKSVWTSPMSTPGAAAWWLIRLCVDIGSFPQEGSPLLSWLLWCRLGEIQGEQGRGGGLLSIHI